MNRRKLITGAIGAAIASVVPWKAKAKSFEEIALGLVMPRSLPWISVRHLVSDPVLLAADDGIIYGPPKRWLEDRDRQRRKRRKRRKRT